MSSGSLGGSGRGVAFAPDNFDILRYMDDPPEDSFRVRRRLNLHAALRF